MKRVLTFRKIVFDSQPLGPGYFPESVSFFTKESDGAEPEPSVATIPERRVMQWLINTPQPRRLLCEELRVPAAAVHRLCVTEPVVPKSKSKPGDIDWLCAVPAEPHFAVAAECKRIKVVAQRDGTDLVNKVESIGEGVLQANALAELGIYRTFLLLLIVVDGQRRTENNVAFRGVTDSEFKKIYEFPQRENLDDDVGVVFVEIVQPSARSLNAMASVAVCVDRPARPREQSTTLTNKILAALRRVD